MKIKFPKFRLYVKLVLGLLWTIAGLYYLFLRDDNSSWTGYFYFAGGFLVLAQFIYDIRNQYLIIENATITKNILYGFKNKIELDQIQEIQKVKGNYILTSETQKMKINLDLVDESSLNNLIDVLSHLNLPSEKSFLTHQK